MKKLLLFLALMIMGSSFLFSQANKVLGFWLTEKETSQVEIYKAEDGKYYGRISWLEELNEELEVLNSEAGELEGKIANNVAKLLEEELGYGG